MSNDGNIGDRARTCVRVTVSIEPMSEAEDALVGLLGSFVFDLSEALGYSRRIGSKANVLIVEETTSVLERSVHSTGELKVHMTMTDEDAEAWCEVRPDPNVPSQPADDWFPPDEPGATRENPTMITISRKRSEIAKAIQERRVDRTQGGLGLIRLMAKKPGGGTGNDEGGSSGAPATVVPLPLKPQ